MGLTGFNKRRREAAALAAKLAAEKKASDSTVSPQSVKAEESVETTTPTHAVGRKKKVVADEGTENK